MLAGTFAYCCYRASKRSLEVRSNCNSSLEVKDMPSNNSPNRREVLGALATTSLAATLSAANIQEERTGDMVFRTFGTTGIKVSAIGLGGSHIGNPKDENEGIRLVRTA